MRDGERRDRRVLDSEPADETVALVVCCYNHERFVVQCLQSALDQTRRPDQLIVVDDGSSDRSRDIIGSWAAAHWPTACLVLDEENLGLPARLNRVVPLVTTSHVAVISGDDWMTPDRVERQLEALEAAGPEYGMVYSDMIEVDEAGEPTGQRWYDADRIGPSPGSGDLHLAMLKRAFISAPSVLTRTAVLREAGAYDERLPAEDYDMFLRLSRLRKWAYIADPLIRYRILGSSLSRSDAFLTRYLEGRLLILKKHIGSGPEEERVIAGRLRQIAVQLYQAGRSPQKTRVDLWDSWLVRATPRTLAYLVLVSLRVPGRVPRRVGSARGRVIAELRARRADRADRG